MEWILENFGKLLPVLLAVLYFWLNSKKRHPDAQEAEDADGPDEAERARRIQEEIRRRILERQRGDSSGPHVEPPVLVEESLHQPQSRQVRSTGQQDVREAVFDPYEIDNRYEEDQQWSDQREVLERQAKLAKRFEEARRLAETRKASQAQIGSSMRNAARPPSVEWAINPLRAALMRDLRGRTGLKRAILLREVLGEPVGLRRGPLPQK
jgi:hypothetical protein